jgi:hypothetical protein
MRRREPTPRAGTSPSDSDELTGFLEGVRVRLLERRREGSPLPDLEQRLASAERAIVARNLPEAERILLEVSDRLDRDEPEPELNEFPRGLLRYEARGERGIPTPEEEEPVGNRLTLVEKLLTVAAAEGVDVAELRVALVAARADYADGDRRRAKERGERVLAELDLRRTARARRQS